MLRNEKVSISSGSLGMTMNPNTIHTCIVLIAVIREKVK